MGSSEGGLGDEVVDRLVLEWLQRRNFSESLHVMQLELESRGAAAAPPAEAWAGAEGGGTLVEGLLLGAAAGGDPAAFAEEFGRLAAWVDGSLDAYRGELSRLLYPVLAHAYLHMVALGAAAEAHALLADHRARVLETSRGPRGAKLRERELHALASLSTAEQVEASPLARAARAARAPARLSRYAYELLMRFLQGARLMAILGVVNERLALELGDAPAGGGADEDGGLLAGGAGLDGADAEALNLAPLDLQRLQGDVEQRYAEAAAARAEMEAAARAEDETAKLTKKQRAALAREVASAKTRREAAGAGRMAAQLPLPEVPPEFETALLQEMGAREAAGAGGAPVGPAALPSAAFFTFLDTHQGLNCAALSADAARVAGGFADSSVRVFNVRAEAEARVAAAAAAAGAVGGSATDYADAGGSAVLRGHAAAVYGVDFSPDESLALSAGGDGTLRLWSLELGAGLVAYRGHLLPVWDCAFAPHHGFYFASAGADRTARLWSTERSQALRVFVGHQADVDVVRWHPNVHYLATGSTDCTARLWDARSGGCGRLLSGHGAPVTALAVSPDGGVLASADAEGSVALWDLGSARRLAAWRAHAGPVWSLAYSNGEGALLASGGADCSVRLWDPAAARAGAGAGADAAPRAPAAAWATKSTPVVALRFTTRNLLLGAGPLALRRAEN
jgi:transcription initiation factor TFIID subunit 5